MLPKVEWPYVQILLRLALSLALGLLIGLERERRGKEAGLRTFGFICLLGALGGSLGDAYGLLILALVGVLAVLLNLHTLRANEGMELTTSAAMLVTCFAGILCGKGHTISPAAVMVIATALLAWKERLADFSMGLTESELRSALLLAILAIVIYPALPIGAVGPWQLIEPRAAWVTVILIAGIGFVNYILWKMYGTRGTELSGFLGGLVNSNFTVIELSSRVREAAGVFVESAYRGILLATTAMLVRNAGLLLVLAPLALVGSFAAFALMLFTSIGLVLWSYRQRRPPPAEPSAQIKLELPFSLPLALKYGVVFLALHVLGNLAQRQFGDVGFYFVSAVGGLMSSASAVAAAATLASQGSLSATVAGTGAVLASFTSIAFSLSFVLRTHHRGLITRLATAMVCVAVAGLIGVLIWDSIYPYVLLWIPGLARLPG
ncbi:MAG: MgtC/SapB family protein [Rubrivivax sp.]|nr:MgtC/SapB family protein [Rubrivivax sp.]MBK8529917.1 MgtC/SapB family protein [Rubrivivax sp.]